VGFYYFKRRGRDEWASLSLRLSLVNRLPGFHRMGLGHHGDRLFPRRAVWGVGDISSMLVIAFVFPDAELCPPLPARWSSRPLPENAVLSAARWPSCAAFSLGFHPLPFATFSATRPCLGRGRNPFSFVDSLLGKHFLSLFLSSVSVFLHGTFFRPSFHLVPSCFSRGSARRFSKKPVPGRVVGDFFSPPPVSFPGPFPVERRVLTE